MISHGQCSQHMVQSATTAVPDLDERILRDSNFCTISVPCRVSCPLAPCFMSSMALSSFGRPFLCLSLSPPCLFLLTSLTYSLKWAWHASRCLTKVCVCGRCLGRWDLLWDTLISSKPRHVQGNTGQVSGTTRYTPWLHLSIRVRSAPSFMAQSLPHPGVPSHPWMLVPFWGSLRSSLNVPSAIPMCANLFF